MFTFLNDDSSKFHTSKQNIFLSILIHKIQILDELNGELMSYKYLKFI